MGKKGKKSRRQLEEELLKAQEEQVAFEIEQAAKKAEDDRIAAEEAEKTAAELAAKNEEERQRLEEEAPKAAQFQHDSMKDLGYELEKIRLANEWEEYIACNTKPDVRYEAEISAYCTNLRETEVLKCVEALNKSLKSEEIVEDLQIAYAEAKGVNNLQKMQWCTEFINDLRDLELAKLDQAMAFFLGHIEPKQINARQEVQDVWGTNKTKIRVGFWGSINPASKFRAKVVDQYRMGVLLELPKSIASGHTNTQIGVRSLYTVYDNLSKNTGPLLSVGGICRVEVLSIPFRPKVYPRGGWIMKLIPPEGTLRLKRLLYPNTEGGAQVNLATLQPCKIEYKVPDNSVIEAVPEVSIWVENEPAEGAEQAGGSSSSTSTGGAWSTEHISEVQFDENTRKISFYSLRLGFFSITQPKNLEFPYSYWIIRPKFPGGEVELQLKTTRFEALFKINNEGVTMLGPALPELMSTILFDGDAPPLPEDSEEEMQERKRKVYHDPVKLLLELRECGINLLPEDSDDVGKTCIKDVAVANKAYADLATISLHNDIVFSNHNRKLEKDQACFRIRANTQYDAHSPFDVDNDGDYKTVLVMGTEKITLVPGTDLKPNFTPIQTHATLVMCMENMELYRSSLESVKIIERLRRLCTALRLLSFH
ncbi:unnamed protein product [Amoebophrya sp. A120]|nr:unnamed protein product [Amoebophrya sp. A120]|eukprot:GSA120T00008752001.1